MQAVPFVVVPLCLDILLFLQPTSTHFFSTFLNFHWGTLKLRDSFFIKVQSFSKTIKGNLHFCYYIYICVCVCFFLFRIAIFLNILPICSCMPSAIFISDLSVLVIFLLHSQCDHSSTSDMWETSSNAHSVSSSCFLAFSTPCKFSLVARKDVLNEINCSK